MSRAATVSCPQRLAATSGSTQPSHALPLGAPRPVLLVKNLEVQRLGDLQRNWAQVPGAAWRGWGGRAVEVGPKLKELVVDA